MRGEEELFEQSLCVIHRSHTASHLCPSILTLISFHSSIHPLKLYKQFFCMLKGCPCWHFLSSLPKFAVIGLYPIE